MQVLDSRQGDFGLIDRIVQPEGVAMDAKDYEGALQQMRSHRQGRVALGAGGPEVGLVPLRPGRGPTECCVAAVGRSTCLFE